MNESLNDRKPLLSGDSTLRDEDKTILDGRLEAKTLIEQSSILEEMKSGASS